MRLIGGALWLPSVMEALAARGITRLLVEGGPATWGAFSRAGLIDEIVLFQARGEDGAEVSAPAAIAAAGRYVSTAGFDVHDRRSLGSDDMLVLRRRHRASIEAKA